MTRIASSEWPPRAKKSSSAPTRSTSSTSAQTRATSSSGPGAGATYSAAATSASGSGSRERSTLPCDLSGSSSSQAYREGTMYAGSRSASHARTSAVSGRAPSTAAFPAVGTR